MNKIATICNNGHLPQKARQHLNLKKFVMASFLECMTMAAGIICAVLTTLIVGL